MSETEPNDPAAPESAAPSRYFSSASLAVAIVWGCLAVIFAIVLLASAQDQEYGGDAYTGIQNAVELAVRGIAFLLLGSGALGIVIAIRRDRN